MGRLARDIGKAADTLREMPREMRRAVAIACAAIVVIGFLLFWPDAASAVGFAVTGDLVVLALVALLRSGVEVEPFGIADAPDAEAEEEGGDDAWL